MTAIIIDFANIYISLRQTDNTNLTATTLDMFLHNRDIKNTKIIFVINDDKKGNHSQLRYIRKYLKDRPMIAAKAKIIGPDDVKHQADSDDLICMSLVINYKFLKYEVILLSRDFYETELRCKSLRVPSTISHAISVPLREMGSIDRATAADDSHTIESAKFSGGFTRFGVIDRVLKLIN